ncbi:MAG: hypothetical protein EBZ20_09035 [Rhodobacteraceae bacterium]|nr:hypothetical protein [Paracoccaceae bacterium]
MTIIGRERYACSARREQGTCTNGMSIKAQDLESRVFQGLQTILLGREEAVKAFADAFHAEVKRLQRNQASNKAAVQKDLVKVETGIKRCVDLLLYSDTPMDSIRATLEDLEAQIVPSTQTSNRRRQDCTPPKYWRALFAQGGRSSGSFEK